jgi:hypothetical protein
MPAKDLLIWVGYQFYPTVNSFVEEAERMGCCRRVSSLPKDIVPGLSRVFLAHLRPTRRRLCKVCGAEKKSGKTLCQRCEVVTKSKYKYGTDPVIFGFYVIGGVEVIVDKEEDFQEMDKLVERYNITPVELSVASSEPRRGCEFRY